MKAVETLYDSPDRRSEDEWRKILDDDRLWNLDVRTAFQWSLFFFLFDHRELPNPIWRLFEDEFHWTRDGRSFYAFAPEEQVDRVLNAIEEAVAMRPGAEPVAMEPAGLDLETGSGFPWWGFLFVLLGIKALTSLSQTGYDGRPQMNLDRAQELLSQRAEERKLERAELEAAAADPEQYRTISVDALERGAQENVPEAQWELARRYVDGDGIRVDTDAARFWLTRAAAAGHEEAKRKLAELDESPR